MSATLAPAGAAAAAPGPPSAAALAARIPVPVELPFRDDGQRLGHLSHSSVSLFSACPDAWRRRYLLSEREAPSGAIFLGSRVDDALTFYYHWLLGQRQHLDVEQIIDRYRDRWREALEDEDAKQGVTWGGLEERAAFELGRQAIAMAFEQLVPKLGHPVAVQRKLEFKLADGLDWAIVCHLDLETTVGDHTYETHRVVDYKVKGAAISSWQADRDPQAGLYLAARWLTGWPAQELCFAQLLKPGRQRKALGAALTTTTRTVAQMRSSLARVAQAASQISVYYDRYGPRRSWGFADPTGWRCSPRYCQHWGTCPGGAGISQPPRAQPAAVLSSGPRSLGTKVVGSAGNGGAPVRDIMRVTGSGNLAREVELRATTSGAQVATLRVAFNTRRPDGRGGWADKANYVDVEVWGGQAVNCAEYLSKGSRVFIDGELDYQEWEDRASGQKRSTLRVRAQTVTFESPASAKGGRKQPPAAAAEPLILEPAGEGTASAEDLPF